MPHDGLPVELYLPPDSTGRKTLSPPLPAGSVLYADAADTD
jgi:hypothetical protein